MFKQHSFLQGLLILVAFGSQLSASIDWGGGLTRFKVGDEFASSENACAVLMSVVSGAPIDFEAFSPDSRADLITPGRELRDGANHNRILAVSRDFLRILATLRSFRPASRSIAGNRSICGRNSIHGYLGCR